MRFLIELPTWLGDSIMATPSIENLVRKNPNIDLVFLGSSSSVEIMRRHPKCSQIFILSRKISSFFKLSKQIGKVDFFISYRGSIRSKLLNIFIKTGRFIQYDKSKFVRGHQVEKYNNFINFYFDINLPPGNLKIYNQSNHEIQFSQPTIGLNPGAKYGSSKCWPAEKYAELAQKLSKNFNIVIFGGRDEINLCSVIESLIPESSKNILNLAGQTSIDDLINRIGQLKLFITGDSGPMHIAAALDVPTISIFGPTKFIETSQWRNKQSIIVKKNFECQPCMERECPLKHHKCMREISVDEIMEKISELI